MADIDSTPVAAPSSARPSGDSSLKIPSKSSIIEASSEPKSGIEASVVVTPENKEVVPEAANDEVDDVAASVLVIILQCETKACDANIANLKWAFSDPYFTVQVCVVDPPTNIVSSKTLTEAQYIENYNMRKALNYAAEGPYTTNSEGGIEAQSWWNKKPVIIIKDSSITNLTPTGFSRSDIEEAIIGGIKRRIRTALDKATGADLFFLCKWNDACDKYVDVQGASDRGSSLKWSMQPTATQAVMYSPTCRDYTRETLMKTTLPVSDLLNSEINQGNLLATVFVPNIIDFDIDLATSNDDYAKLNECAPVQGDPASTSNSTIVWLILIIILVVLVAWALIQLSSVTALTS